MATKIDPVLLEVIWNRFLSVANEQQDALIRTAFSTIVRESQDLACGMFDTKGRMIAQSLSGTPGHINAMATSMRHFLAAYPPDKLAPGDVLITNDPWQTAGQINDITITTPIFRDDKMVALFANTCHSADIGGRILSAEAREVFEEGLRIPIMKLFDRGEPNHTLMQLVRINVRQPDEVAGIYQDILLTRASDDMVHRMGQDGGLVSALLIWAMENDYIDGALVSYLEGDGTSWKARPGVASSKEQVLESAGSRYTYSANTLAINEAIERGLSRLALVGMSCQSSVPPIMWSRKAGKIGKPFLFNIGLLCSKTFDDSIFDELFLTKYGLDRAEIVKMNIKGVFQIWMRDGSYHEINLKECHAWTRDGCHHCPDFAAEHADISTGGIGKYNDWTLTVVRTDLGREIMIKMLEDGSIEGRPGDDDPGAIELMRKLSIKSRKRWGETVHSKPALLPS